MGQAAMSSRTGCALLKPTHLRAIEFIKTLRQGRSMRCPVGYWAGAGVLTWARRGLPLPAVMAPGRRLFCGAEPPTSTPHCTLCPQEWLSRFGYLPPADPETGQLQTPEELSKAIVAMQRFGGLEATGVLGQFSGCRGRWVS